MTRYAIVYKDTGDVYRMFNDYNEALYCITDSFGPEGSSVTIIEVLTGE